MPETFRFVASLLAPPDAGLARMPILVTGSWVKGGREVSFTRAELEQAIENFQKLANHDLNVDYDHACEDLERAAGDPTPSAGRIVALDEPEEYPGKELRTGESATASATSSTGATSPRSGRANLSKIASTAIPLRPSLRTIPTADGRIPRADADQRGADQSTVFR